MKINFALSSMLSRGLLLSSFILGGCGGKNDNQNGSTPEESSATQDSQNTSSKKSAPSETPSDESASGENTLRYPMIADAKSFDPILVEELYSSMASTLVYEGLFEYEYLKRPHSLQPLLAESMPKVSKDGLTYTIKIRKGVNFIDDAAFPSGKGREVKAKDFVYSYLRVADPRVESGSFWIFDGHILGLNEWRNKQKSAAKTDFSNPPEGIKALDDYTLQIKLKDKYPQLLFVLAMPQTFVVPFEAVEKYGKDFGNHPVGTGPFKLESWVRNSKITYTRNLGWRGQPYPSVGEPQDKALGLLDDAGKTMPFVDRVEYRIFVESQPQWLNFMSGSVDLINIPKDNYSQAIDGTTKGLLPELASNGINLTKAIEPDLVYFAFNMEDPVIKKGGPKLRKALSLAMDKQRTVDMFYNGRATVAHSVVPPGIAGFDENFKNPYTAYNVELAKKYLAEAGYPGGKGLPEFVYETNNGTDQRQRAEKLVKEMAAIGIKMRVNYNQFAELTEKLNQKKAQMWGIAWIADYPDAENFLQLLYGPNKAPAPNAANYDNPKYNDLYRKVRGMADSPARRKLITQMKQIIVDDLPWIVEAHRIRFGLQHAWLKNFKPGDMTGFTQAKYLRIDTEKKKQGLK